MDKIINEVNICSDQCGHTWRFHEDRIVVHQCKNCKSPEFHIHVHSSSGYQVQALSKYESS